jgi:hypothetical protein
VARLEEARIVGESRWRWQPPWVVPLVEGILLVALIAGDPGAIAFPRQMNPKLARAGWIPCAP